MGSYLRTAKLAAPVLVISIAAARAQMIPLADYADANGFIDLQILTCGQLADVLPEDADYLTAWYSGWHAGLAKKQSLHITGVRSGENQLILYCKEHPQPRVIEAVDVITKNGN